MTCQREMKMRTYQMNKLYLDKLYIPLRGGDIYTVYYPYKHTVFIQFYTVIQFIEEKA
jgi:hypothetical protein